MMPGVLALRLNFEHLGRLLVINELILGRDEGDVLLLIHLDLIIHLLRTIW